MAGKRSLMLVEPKRLVRQGLCELIHSLDHLTVLAEAANGHEAVEQVRLHQPELILLDSNLPDRSCALVCQKLLAESPASMVLVLADDEGQGETIRQLFRTGACGLVHKDCDRVELHQAIESCLRGKSYVSPQLAVKLTDELDQPKSNAKGSIHSLSSREVEVLTMLSDGKTTKQIALALKISDKTVETHRRNLTQKLDLYTLPELTKFAIRHGLTSVNL